MTDLPPPPPFSPPPMAPPPGYQPYGGYAQVHYAGFGARLGAYIIDALVMLLFSLPAIIAVFVGPSETELCTINDELRLCDVPTGATIAITAVLGILAFVAYLFLWTKKVGATGQTWGMSAAGTRVVDADTGQPIGQGRAVGRFFGRLVSGWVCYIGFVWMLFDQRKQTWHDKMVNSIVVKG